jgi:hypothetical protein
MSWRREQEGLPKQINRNAAADRINLVFCFFEAVSPSTARSDAGEKSVATRTCLNPILFCSNVCSTFRLDLHGR